MASGNLGAGMTSDHDFDHDRRSRSTSEPGLFNNPGEVVYRRGFVAPSGDGWRFCRIAAGIAHDTALVDRCALGHARC